MDFFTVVLITGTLSSQGQILNQTQQITKQVFNYPQECQKVGATLAARLSRKNFGSSGEVKRSGHKQSRLEGQFVGYFCQKSDHPLTPSATSGKPNNPNKTPITLYTGTNFMGRNAILFQSNPDLAQTAVGNNAVSSILVPKGCHVTLYDQSHYQGSFVRLSDNQLNLSKTPLGDNRASSIKIECLPSKILTQGKPAKKQVTLFTGANFTGQSQHFTESQPFLGQTIIGRNTLSSIKMDAGCQVTVYSKGKYQGRKSTFYQDRNRLYGTTIDDDSADSFTMQCPEAVDPANVHW